MGAAVSCRQSVPSARQRHSELSAMEVYATHLPSREKCRFVAEGKSDSVASAPESAIEPH